MDTIDGVLERITFYNEENCFLVGKIQSTSKKEMVTIVGNIPAPQVGEELSLEGSWAAHPVYGEQFKVQKYQRQSPSSLQGIEKYLASGLIKGIGPSTAKRLVERFGKDILEILEKEPKKLEVMPGLGRKRVKQISESYQEQLEMKEIMVFFQEYNIGPGYATRIFKQLGQETVSLVKSNPYRLSEIVFGIGFKTADKIAQQMGVQPNEPARIKAAIKFLLQEGADNGHLYLPRKELMDKIYLVLDIDEKDKEIEAAVEELVYAKEVFVETTDEGMIYYFAPFFYAELGTTRKLKILSSRQLVLGTSQPELDMDILEERCQISLADGQKEAVNKARDEGVLVITGGPGTGKTTVVNALLEMFSLSHLEVILAAPTGRAAKRITETTGREAKTIHRLLEYSYVEGEGFRFNKNESNPLKAHVVIIDEVSMVDMLLMYNLLKAIPVGCKLILVGDVDQLPAVGPGNVLKDMINSGVISTVRLEIIFRQARESLIIVNAHRINKGEFPYIKNSSKDFFFMEEQDPEKILSLMIDLCSHRLPKYGDYDRIRNIQVLTPMRKTILGVDNLNLQLQKSLNPPAQEKSELNYEHRLYRQGDKVMQLRNNYEKEVFNGDMGFITHISKEDGELIVSYPDTGGYRDIFYNLRELDELSLAYATSVHKSQGSEYPAIVMPLVTQHYILLQRKLLYTAITRAKEMVVLIGQKKALAISINNNKTQDRYTRLEQRLTESFSMEFTNEHIE